MTDIPQSIRAIRQDRVLEITWGSGLVCRYPFHFLRCQCPCASCVNEFTGVRTVDPAKVPEDVHPEEIGHSGNYALKIKWSDGHFTGLYAWDLFEQLTHYDAVQQVSPASTDS